MTKFSSTPQPSREALYTALSLLGIGIVPRHEKHYLQLRQEVEDLLLVYEPEHTALRNIYASINAYTKLNALVSNLLDEYQVWLNLRAAGAG